MDKHKLLYIHCGEIAMQSARTHRLCQAVGDAIAVVISRDGGLRFVRWHDDAVSYWDQLATGPWEV